MLQKNTSIYFKKYTLPQINPKGAKHGEDGAASDTAPCQPRRAAPRPPRGACRIAPAAQRPQKQNNCGWLLFLNCDRRVFGLPCIAVGNNYT